MADQLAGLMRGSNPIPDPGATAYEGHRPFLAWDDLGDDLISNVRATGRVYTWFAYGSGPTDPERGWFYRVNRGEPSGPYDTSKDAYETAIGW